MSLSRHFFLLLFALLFSGFTTVYALETMPERTLRQLVERQQSLFADAEKDNPNFDQENFKSQLQQICNSYEVLLRDNPKFAAGYVSYGLLLGKVDMQKQAVGMLMKANEIDKNIPVVKNQLGNFLAEEGRPLEAVNYYLSAIQLEPKEPLYHYQLGTLLAEAQDDFVKSGEWTKAALDKAMHHAFEEAMTLSPGDWRYAYRYGMSYYDLNTPEWEEALQFWQSFEKKLKPGVEQQTCRLHEAKILFTLHRPDDARAALQTVTEPVLAKQKEKLVAQTTDSPK